MTDDDAVDYADLVDGTVDEVKERVRDDEDIDVEQVLEAEKAGKNRVTLTDWLEEQMDAAEADDGTTTDDADREHDASTEPAEIQVSGDVLSSRHAVFGAGIVTGVVLTVLVVATGMLPVSGQPAPNAVSTDAAADRLDTYLEENKDVFLPPRIQNQSSLAVDTVERYEDSSLYRVTLQFSLEQNGQTRTQTVPGYMTQDGNYVLFGGQLFALDTPAREQIQQQQPRQVQ